VITESSLRARIKTEVRGLVRERCAAVLVEELEVARRARVDLAIISDRLIGIEIKGPKDDVSRLPGQVAAYSECFERVVLVVHESLAERALPLVPKWWGVVVAREGSTGLEWSFERRPRPNPAVQPNVFLSLLWREEICVLHQRLIGGDADAKATKRDLRDQLLAKAKFGAVRRAALACLRQRKGWRGTLVH
jgi:hypothetical protein